MISVSTIVVFILTILFLIASTLLGTQTVVEQTTNPTKVANINPNISKITEDLYLTNFPNAKDYDALRALGVRQILTIGSELPRHGEPFFKVMHIKLDDMPTEPIKKYFNQTYDFIKRDKTVVHCAAGISRSATIVAAYLMRKYGLTRDKALAHIFDRRPIINPNSGFKEQLKQFETEIANADSNPASTNT